MPLREFLGCKAGLPYYQRCILPLEIILDCCDIYERTFRGLLGCSVKATGSEHTEKAPSALRGRPRKLHREDVQYTLRLVHHGPYRSVNDLVKLLEMSRLVSVHFSTVCTELTERHGISLKELRKISKERNEDQAGAFMQQNRDETARALVALRMAAFARAARVHR